MQRSLKVNFYQVFWQIKVSLMNNFAVKCHNEKRTKNRTRLN